MKKIIVACFILFVGLLGYSSSAYLNSDQCPGGMQCKDGYSIDSSTCTALDGTLYFQYTNPNGHQKTGSVGWCVGQTYGSTGRVSGPKCYSPSKCCPVGSVIIGDKCKRCNSLTTGEVSAGGFDASNCVGECNGEIYSLPNNLDACCPGELDENGQCNESLSEGITINTRCLLNGQCSMNSYKVLGIRESNENPTVMGFFQDITLASTTAFLGTVVVIALVVSGLLFAFASITGKDTKRAKSILIDTFVGMLLVMGSYIIIRLIQFIATAGS